MPRTPEQISADDALTVAIERVARAYGVLEDGDVTGDYVVVANVQQLEEEGDIMHSYIMLLRNGRIAGVATVGLLEMAAFDAKLGRRD